ncbi:alpha/beta fold hydrolase [Deinococcus detaillensis]|uniref:Alpha/beta fold hydrolase n=1 Tax=Deinococcus detaillensis TaxID=2592048 RepID=A0A553UJF2_9DEIO|nr:alpha/beta hydrolase [Deinococcus detaillensis]TSA80322.1 alpha/beta fold hydrolase [Deinococcus detaillensis]
MQIGDVHLNVQRTGKGRPLLMLHGLMSNLTALQPEIQRLSESFEVIALDSRGHGSSDKPAHYTLQDHINDVLGVMDALNLRTVDLMGTSMGSYIAQGVASQQPDRVRKLVLVVPKSNGKTSSVARFIAQHQAEVKGLSQEEIQALVLSRIFAPSTPQSVRAAQATWSQQQAEQGLTLNSAQAESASLALAGFDFRPMLPNITAETLVISGRHDILNPLAEGQLISKLIPKARLKVLDHSGHLPNLEEPEQLLELVEEFLKS